MSQTNYTNIRLSHEAHNALKVLAALRQEPMSKMILFLVRRELAQRERQIANKVIKAREERAHKKEVEAECSQ